MARYLHGTHGREFTFTKQQTEKMLATMLKMIEYVNNLLVTIDFHSNPTEGKYIAIGKVYLF